MQYLQSLLDARLVSGAWDRLSLGPTMCSQRVVCIWDKKSAFIMACLEHWFPTYLLPRTPSAKDIWDVNQPWMTCAWISNVIIFQTFNKSDFYSILHNFQFNLICILEMTTVDIENNSRCTFFFCIYWLKSIKN